MTAGKADEVVADLGGPLPEHSVFSGHLLEGLQGKAANAEGILTANGLMAYVYQSVGQDPDSAQTPHYGYLRGDGDMIFLAPQLSKLEAPTDTADAKKDKDILVPIPSALQDEESTGPMSIIDQTKEYLSEDHFRIKLHELVARKTREVIDSTGQAHFSTSAPWSTDEFKERLKKYEAITTGSPYPQCA